MPVTATSTTATRVVQQEVREQVVTIVIDRQTASQLTFPMHAVRHMSQEDKSKHGILDSEQEAMTQVLLALYEALDK